MSFFPVFHALLDIPGDS